MESRALRRLADRVVGIERTVRAMASAPQLANSAIVDGAIDQIKTVDTGRLDDYGNPIFEDQIVSRVGEQEDGSNTISVFDGPKPPMPVAPIVKGGPGFLSVEWTGEFVDRFEAYADHDFVAVHVGTEAGFLPNADTQKGTIRSTAGETLSIPIDPGSYYVSLVAVSQAGVWSDPAPYSNGAPGEASAVDVTARQMAQDAQNTADDARTRADDAQAAADAASAAANAADQKAINAQNDATVALTSADSKTKVVYSLDHRSVAPTTMPDLPIGTIWYRTASDGTVIEIAELISKDGSGWSWMDRPFTDSVVTSITAGKITTGTLDAATTITTGDPNGTHTILGQSSLQVWRPDGDGEPQVTVSVGGADRDVLMITDPTTGATLAGFDGDGGGYAQNFGAGTMTVGGQAIGYPYELDDILFQFPRGRIAGYSMKVDGTKAGTTPLGLCEIGATCYSYRMYRARYEGNFYCDTVGTFRLFLYYTSNGSTPTINSNQMVMGIYPTNSVAGHRRASIEGYFFVPGAYNQETQVRVLLAMQRITGGGQIWHHSDGGQTPGRFTIEDLGPQSGITADLWDDGAVNTGGGTPAAGGGGTSTPPTTKQTYTKTYAATWSRNWRNGTIGNSEVRQGYYSARYHGAIGFPSQVQTDLNGASISKMELYLYANHWYYNNGGTAVIGAHTSSSAPPLPPTGSGTFNAAWSTKTGGKWITIPSSWYQYWASGNNKGITLGDTTSTSYSYYGRFNGYGMANPPKLRVTYQK